MKRFLSIVFCLIFSVFLSITAYATENAEISFDTYSSEKENNVCVDINISEEGSPAMLQFCVAYDSSVLDIVSVTTGDAFLGNSAPVINQVDGKIYFIWDSFTPLEDGGNMLHVEFAPKTEGKTEVWIDQNESFVVADSSFNDIGSVNGKAEINTKSSEKPKDEESSSSSSSKAEQSSGSNNGINIDKNEVSVELGGETKIEVTDENKDVVWYSSNEDVVKVENGEVVPVAPGTATITVTNEEGDKEATCVVTVTEDGVITEEVESEEVKVLYNDEQTKTPAWVWIIIFIILAVVVFIAVKIFRKIKK